jgi:hypothetical protein
VVVTLLTAVAVCGLLVVLVWPLFTVGSRLTGDAIPHAAFIEHQAQSMRQGVLPSLFQHNMAGIFYAVFAFYGGTLFAIAGAISLVAGSPMGAQAVVYVLALGAAYGGWFWMARMAGVGYWAAHAPALLYVTAPYVMTNVNSRQDLTETVATSMLPLLLASAVSVMRADRLRAGPTAALAGSTIVLGGSHNLTLLWATTILAITLPFLILGVPQARHMIRRRGLLRVLAVAVPAMAVNAWYMIPNLAYHSHTVIAQRIEEWRAAVLDMNASINAEHLFSIGPSSPFPDSGFSATLPMLAIAWVLIAAVLAHRQWRQAWGRTLLFLSVAVVAVVVVMTHPRAITAFPDPWVMIQYSYRLETYALFGICSAVIAALALLRNTNHRWVTALLLPIVAFSVIGAITQIRDVSRYPADVVWSNDRLVLFSSSDFADASLKDRSAEVRRIVVFSAGKVHRDRVDLTVRARPREIVNTDLMAIPPMIDIQGAHVVGQWARTPLNAGWLPYRYLTLQIDDDATPGKAHITIRPARPLPVVSGQIITILGLLGLTACAVVIVRGRRRG